MSHSSEAVTRDIWVRVKSEYLPSRSSPQKSQFFFAYHITISNLSDQAVQLLTRHWTIVDGTGRTEEVRGAGVVGAQPRLETGESFEYTSYCPLNTQVGTMRGTFEMITDGGERFDVRVATFTLALPHAMN